MNRRTLIASAAVLPIAACGTTGGGGTGLPADAQTFIDEVMQYVAIGCKFLPTIGSVLALFGMAAPAVVGKMICDALNPPGVAAATSHYPGAKRTVTVAGKPVAGVFLR